MRRINWFKRSSDPKDLLCIGERTAYASANTGIAFSYCLLIAFMSYYYTDVIGISAGAVGTIFLVSRIFDGISDLLMGWVVDRTNTKIGKARPWILIMAIPHAVACTLAFAVPTSWTAGHQYIYVFITYNLVNAVTYTMANIPIWAENCLLTSNPEEHAKSGIWMQVGGSAVLFLVQYTCLSLVSKLGNDPRAWTIAAAIYSALGAACMIFSALVVRERVETHPEENKVPLKVRLKALFANKYWVLYTLTWLVSSIMYYFIDAGCIYYADSIIGDPGAYAQLATMQSIISAVLLLVAMTWVIKKLGNVTTNTLSFVFFFIGCGIQLFTTNWSVILFCNALKGLGMAMNLAAQGGLMADACSYGSKKAGFDISGIGNAGINFGSKLGMGLGGVIMGWVLELFEYDGTATVQTAHTLQGVNWVYLIIPMITAVICILFMVPYDLYKKVRAGEAEL